MPGDSSQFISSSTFAQPKDSRGWAHGVIVRRAGSDPTWPGDAGSSLPTITKTVDSTTETLSSGSVTSGGGGASPNGEGLSSGTKIGIGVGVTVGSAFIAGSVIGAYLGFESQRNSIQ